MKMTNSPIRIRYTDLELAYMMVSDGQGDVECYVDPLNGAIYCVDPFGDCSDELPEGFDADACLLIPGKYDLDLGKQLVFDFVQAEQLDYDYAEDLFRRKGAYSRYKDWLLDIGKLDDWHAYEAQCTREALAQWCAENGVTLVD